MTEYAHPEVLVDCDWVQTHFADDGLVVVEVDVDSYSYDEAHIEGALAWDWTTQLCDTRRRDILSREGFEALMRRSGIHPSDTVVLYGDNNNWFAAWALWQMKIYGHADVRIMNGGRTKWLMDGRPLSSATRTPHPCAYEVTSEDHSLRTLLADLVPAVEAGKIDLVDVRSPAEFRGDLLAPPGLPETCQRGGHIPGASNVPWASVCNDDGTFKSRDELAALYASTGVTGDRPVVAYCRIGERSSHTWFVLRYLLGYDDVTNYDGSWTEWGNLVAAEIEL